MVVTPEPATGESVRFRSAGKNLVEFSDVPDHVRQEARNRNSRVCGYNPHCQTCFRDDDGMTYVDIC